jgi:transporter family-2 protein
MASTGSMAAVMVAAGVGIPIMAALNAALGARIGPPMATVSLFAVALVAALVVAAMGGGLRLAAAPPHLFLGGLFVAFYVVSITTLAPRLGVATAVMLVLLGQLFSAAAIDHFGLFGAARTPIDWRRVLGLVAMAVGVLLARRPG